MRFKVWVKSDMLPMGCLFFLCALSTSLSAMMGGPAAQDPLERLDYRAAFKLDSVHKIFFSLMEEMGCDENVFDKFPEVRINVENTRRPSVLLADRSGEGTLLTSPLLKYTDGVSIGAAEAREGIPAVGREIELFSRDLTSGSGTFSALTERVINEKTLKLYEETCLSKLRKERRYTLLEPAKEAGTVLLLMGGATATVLFALGSNSYGGSIGISAALFNAIWFVRDIIRSGYNLYSTPPHDLDELERRFSVNQCYIPKALWPIITEKFITARHNSFEHQSTVNYIDFALGLTIYAPNPSLRLERRGIRSDEEIVENILWGLSRRIDRFFEDYKDFEEVQQIHTLKMNVRKFVLAVLGKQGEVPRYLYLCGPGGIGKTHFSQALVDWIKEELPNSVRHETLDVTSPDELEGSATRPGVFLNVLRNQCIEKKRGSVVVMDEASFLNLPIFISPSKRVFNGTFSQLKTTYFGAGADGSGVILNVPPILLLATDNEEIDDLALRSRFDVVNFPNPKPKALLTYAKKFIDSDSLSKKIPGLFFSIRDSVIVPATLVETSDERIPYVTELEAAIDELVSFRDVQTRIPILLSEWYERARGIESRNRK